MRIRLALVSLGAFWTIGPLAAQPTPLGSELQVNSYTTDAQRRVAVASDAAGDFVVVWESYGSSGSDSSKWSIQGQRFAANSTPLGSQFQVNSYTTDLQEFAAVASDAAGDFVVVWHSKGGSGTDATGYSVQGQRFAADGTALGAQFQVNSYTTSSQANPAVASDAAGDFVVVWMSYGSSGSDSSNWSIQGQRYAADGAPLGSQFQVNSYTTNEQRAPRVASDPAGNFVVVWQSYGSSGSDTLSRSIQGQRYAADGSTLGGEFQVNSYTTGYQALPVVASDAAGNFVVVWESQGSSGSDKNGWSLQGQRYAADGTTLGSQFQVNSYTTSDQDLPSVASDAAGNFVVVWMSYGSSGTDKSSYSVLGQRYAANGAPLGGEFQANTFTTGAQGSPAVASDAAGRFLVVWGSTGSSGSDNSSFSIHGQRYGFPTIPVNSSAGTTGGPSCTLRDALTAAASSSATGGCVAGNQGAVIDLQFAGDVVLNVADNNANGLPVVTNNVQILGHGKTISRLGSLGCPGVPQFRLFSVSAGAVLRLDDTTLAGGCVPGDGGGGIESAGAVVLQSSAVSGSQSANGAGIDASAGLFLFDSTLAGNTASAAGGGVRTTPVVPADAPALFFRSTLSGNTAASGAGASLDGFTLATNVTVSGNTGGGLELAGNGQLSFVTVTANSTQAGLRSTSGKTTLVSSLVGGNPGGDCAVAGGSLAAQGLNLDVDGTCLAATVSSFTNVGSLGLGPLAANGGPTHTQMPSATSPALDAALDCKTFSGALLLTDQNSRARPTGPACDLGAVERPISGLPFADGFETGNASHWAAQSP